MQVNNELKRQLPYAAAPPAKLVASIARTIHIARHSVV